MILLSNRKFSFKWISINKMERFLENKLVANKTLKLNGKLSTKVFKVIYL